MSKTRVTKDMVKVLRKSKSQASLPTFQPVLNANTKQKLVKSDDDLSPLDKKKSTFLNRDWSMPNLLPGQGSKDQALQQSHDKKNNTSPDIMGSSLPKDMASPTSYNRVTRNFKVANNGDIILPRQDTPQSKIPLNIMPQTTEEYQGLFSKDSIELTPPLNAIISRKQTQNELAVDSYGDKDNPKGIETITYSGAISLRLSALENQIAESQKKVEGIIQIYSLRNEDKKAQQNALSSIKYDNLFIQELLDLSQYKQSLATNQLMLIFQQQAELLQAQVDPTSTAYVKYNSEEKKLIAKIQQEATILYNKGVELDELVAKGANQKRADKLVNSELLDTKFDGLTNTLRNRDKGLKLDEVNPHYSLDDLKVILEQFQKANKEMGALLKMPDVSKRCGLLASLYDCATTLATKAAFLIPQTAVAAVSIIEYGISTVVVDTVKQGLTSAKNAGSAVWEKRDAFVDKTIAERNNRIIESINKNRKEALSLKDKLKEMVEDKLSPESKSLKDTYNRLIEEGQKSLSPYKQTQQILDFLNGNNIILDNLPDIKQLKNLEKQFEQLDAQLDKAKADLFPRVASAILGVPAAMLLGAVNAVAQGAWAGVKNTTVNMPEGIKANYKAHAKPEVEVEGKGKVRQDRFWNKSLSEIHTPNKKARDIAYRERAEAAEAAEAKKILANEAEKQNSENNKIHYVPLNSNTKDNNIKFVRQNRQAKLQEYIEKTEASIKEKDAELAKRIGGVANLIQPATPENVIKNRILTEDTEDKELLKGVVELTKLKQQNTVSNIMLPFLAQAESVEQQVYADKSQEQKINEEIQDLAISLAEKASVLNEKIEKEISHERPDSVDKIKKSLTKDLTHAINNNLKRRDTMSDSPLTVDDLNVIRDVYKKANKQMDALIKMPDVSQRCGLLAALYDCTTALAKRSAFLIPQTAAAAASIVEYAIMTVVVDTVKQGWTSAKNAGKDVWEKRDAFIKETIKERTDLIKQSLVVSQDNINYAQREFIAQTDERMTSVRLRPSTAQALKDQYQNLKAKGDLLEIQRFFDDNKLIDLKKQIKTKDGEWIPEQIYIFNDARHQIANLEETQKELERKLQKAASAPVISFATAVLGVPEAVIVAAFRGVVNTIVAGAKNITFNASGDKQLGKRWEKRTTDEHGKKKSWARNLGQVHSDDRKARGERHKDKAERGIAARELKRRADTPKQGSGYTV